MKSGETAIVTGDRAKWWHDINPGTEVILVRRYSDGDQAYNSDEKHGWKVRPPYGGTLDVADIDLTQLVSEDEIQEALKSIQRSLRD